MMPSLSLHGCHGVPFALVLGQDLTDYVDAESLKPPKPRFARSILNQEKKVLR